MISTTKKGVMPETLIQDSNKTLCKRAPLAPSYANIKIII